MERMRDEKTSVPKRKTPGSTSRENARGEGTTAENMTSDKLLDHDGILNAAMEDEDSDTDTVLDLDSDEASEVLDFMKPFDPIDIAPTRLTADDESEDMQGLFNRPVRVARSAKRARAVSSQRRYDMSELMEETEEREQVRKSRWLITTCRYCAQIYRFRADEPQPPTCGKPQCIARFEEITKKPPLVGVDAG